MPSASANRRTLKTILEKDQMAYDLGETGLAQGTGTLLDVNKLKSDLAQTHYLYQQAKVEAHDACLDLAAALQLSLDQPLVFLDDKDFLETLKNKCRSTPEPGQCRRGTGLFRIRAKPG